MAAGDDAQGEPGVSGRRIGFVRWRSDLPSGGNRYDEELVAGLRARGFDLREHPVAGPWPVPRPAERRRLAETLAAERDWLIGNIVASAVPELIDRVTGAGRRVTVLLHYFPADDPALGASDRERLAGTEAATIAAASAVVTTSAWAAREVATRYGRDDAVVAVPGVERAEPAPGSAARGRPPALLWLARLTPTKDPLTFLDALARLSDLEWTARLVGPDTLDAALARRVRERVAAADLAGRVEVTGERTGAALAHTWADTDLLVHTSRAETYGMVVSEALARGVPSVVASGTGAVEAQRAGATFPPGDAAALADVLRGWLGDARLRLEWRAAAVAARDHLPTWSDAAGAVAAVLAP